MTQCFDLKYLFTNNEYLYDNYKKYQENIFYVTVLDQESDNILNNAQTEIDELGENFIKVKLRTKSYKYVDVKPMRITYDVLCKRKTCEDTTIYSIINDDEVNYVTKKINGSKRYQFIYRLQINDTYKKIYEMEINARLKLKKDNRKEFLNKKKIDQYNKDEEKLLEQEKIEKELKKKNKRESILAYEIQKKNLIDNELKEKNLINVRLLDKEDVRLLDIELIENERLLQRQKFEINEKIQNIDIRFKFNVLQNERILIIKMITDYYNSNKQFYNFVLNNNLIQVTKAFHYDNLNNLNSNHFTAMIGNDFNNRHFYINENRISHITSIIRDF